jgi:hypothetical protein
MAFLPVEILGFFSSRLWAAGETSLPGRALCPPRPPRLLTEHLMGTVSLKRPRALPSAPPSDVR